MSNAKKGTKIEGAEAQALDKSKGYKTTSDTPDVEGQDIVVQWTECPWCGHLGRSVVDTERYTWYECGGCGRPFKA